MRSVRERYLQVVRPTTKTTRAVSKDDVKRDRPYVAGCAATTPSAAMLISLLGHDSTESSYEGVRLSPDEKKALQLAYGYTIETGEDARMVSLLQAGADMSMYRKASKDGLRLVAVLASHGLLEPNEDPVKAVIRLLLGYGAEVSECDSHWAEEEATDHAHVHR